MQINARYKKGCLERDGLFILPEDKNNQYYIVFFRETIKL